MKFMKTTTFLATGLGFTMLNVGAALADMTRCVKGSDVRTLEIVTPGMVGSACDFKYVRDAGSNISIPYHANNQADFCAIKAGELKAELEGIGFTCSPVLAAQPGVDQQAQNADQNADQAAAPSGTATGAAPASAVEEAPVKPAPKKKLRANAAESAAEIEADAENLATARALVAAAPVATSVSKFSAPIGLPSADRDVSTLDAETRSTPTLSYLEFDDGAASASAGNASAGAEAGANDAAASGSGAGRPAEDIIRGVLQAQAAAWNEGNLAAFMAGYWDDPGLRMVSGVEVTKGWKQVQRRYKARYGDGRDLGRLSFDELAVEMLTPDSAVVLGRYALDHNGEPSSGTFSLVVKRFNGLWRIVHDHTSADPVAPAESSTETALKE